MIPGFITKYGLGTIGVAAFVALILIVAAFYISNPIIKYVLIAIAVVLMVFTLQFFRDPDRTPPSQDNIIVSPADGKVLFIKEIESSGYIQGAAKQISIFMSPINVHVNRIPLSGSVEYYKYHEGEYLMAFDDKASERNERSEIGIKGENGKVFFTQVAGFIARRIVCELNEGDTVTIGERFGMIKFGSRSDIIVPAEYEIKVKKDDNVYAGETVLFEIPEKE